MDVWGTCWCAIDIPLPAYLGVEVLDAVLGIRFLKSQGVRVVGRIGHSLVGAAVIPAAAAEQIVRIVVMLPTQCFGADPIKVRQLIFRSC